MNHFQQNHLNIVNQTLTLVQNSYHFYVMINERDSVKEKIEKIQEQFHSIEKDIEIKDDSELDKKFKEIWQAISYLVHYEKLQYPNKTKEIENYLNIIKSIYAIIDLYKTHCQNYEVNKNIIDQLKKIADDLADKYLTYLDNKFWVRYKTYHYLKNKKISEKIIYGYNTTDHNLNYYYCLALDKYDQNEKFNESELRDFFDSNANIILPLFVYAEMVYNKYLNFYFIKFTKYSYDSEYGVDYPFFCFESDKQVFAFLIDIEMTKLDELYQSLKHHGKDILNG